MVAIGLVWKEKGSWVLSVDTALALGHKAGHVFMFGLHKHLSVVTGITMVTGTIWGPQGIGQDHWLLGGGSWQHYQPWVWSVPCV